MKNAVILHGTEDSSKEQWFPWLKTELEKKDYRVWSPDLPDADKPNVCTYNIFIDKNNKFNSDTVMIGHSSGATSILGWLNKIPENRKINKAIMVAGFKDNLGIEACSGLFIYDFDWEKLKRMADEYIIIHSDNDPYVPVEHAEYFREKLRDKAKLVILKGQKHFSVSTMGDKYKQFPELLKHI